MMPNEEEEEDSADTFAEEREELERDNFESLENPFEDFEFLFI